MIPFKTDIPAPTPDDHHDFYGPITVPKSEILWVQHITGNVPLDGSQTANYCHTNPNGYRWHRSVGATSGKIYRHTAPFGESGSLLQGAHDAGLNHRSVGCEFTLNCDDDAAKFPIALNQAARELALFAWKVHDKPPKRGWPAGDGFVIGHEDDSHYGGTSGHVDPTCGKSGPKPWPWDDFMALANRWYDHLREEDDVNDTQDRVLRRIWNDLKNEAVTRGVKDVPPSIDTNDDEPPYKGWVERLNTKRSESEAQIKADLKTIKSKVGA